MALAVSTARVATTPIITIVDTMATTQGSAGHCEVDLVKPGARNPPTNMFATASPMATYPARGETIRELCTQCL